MGGITSAVADLSAALASALDPDLIRVLPFARNIDPPDLPTLMFRLDGVKPSKVAGGLWELSGALVLVGAVTDPGAGDVALDDALSDVLLALATPPVSEALNWSEATRGGYPNPDPTNPAYEVAVTTHTVKE